MKRILFILFAIAIMYAPVSVTAQNFDADWASYTEKLKGRKGGYTVQVKLSAVNMEGKPDHSVGSEGYVQVWGTDYYLSSFNNMLYLVTPDWHIFVDKSHKKMVIRSLQGLKKRPEAIEKPVSASQKAEKRSNGYYFALSNGGSCQVVFSSDGLLTKVLYENTGGMKSTDIVYSYREADFSKADFSEDVYIRREKGTWKPQPAYAGYKLIVN